MIKPVLLIPALFAFIFMALPQAHAQEVVLRPSWQVGKKYTTRIIQEMVAQSDKSQDQQIMSMQQKLGLTVKAGPEAKRKSVEMTFDETRVKTNMLGGQQVEFDSADPDKQQGPLAPALNKLKEQKITLVYDETEGLLEIKGLTENAAAAGPGSLSEEQIRTILSYDMVRSLPAEARKSGDTWKYEATIKNSELDLQIKADVTFAGYEKQKGKKLAKILFEGAVAASLSNANNNQVKFSDTSHYTGTMLIDTERRVLVKSDATLHLGMEINGKPMTMKQKVLSDLVAMEDAK